ncbi:hypothetical protein MJO28_006634 [Puccinia striiformis f. sp. tritici]|uniref:Uncharacterized protein n=1 Tax=Puccinia striiformis f. sp. tritici TaxID=168172 RepID=A0ACC0EJ90_9BASI|nr:hypothetical protein Pst134EB_012774 [Puccinia striiformis f. sp. tritici]KAI7954087.1 hypothetical protein MJO28_006634 [Puccinia striiformis f. sp. tritici]
MCMCEYPVPVSGSPRSIRAYHSVSRGDELVVQPIPVSEQLLEQCSPGKLLPGKSLPDLPPKKTYSLITLDSSSLQRIATEAFEFCLTHTRKTEFRRLAETLRANLTSSQNYTNQAHSINLSDPDVLQRHLKTRFQQLNTSVRLELWQESFRTAEDINGLIGLSKKVPKNHVMSAFYEKMIKVFGVGDNHLFHAARYNNYFTIQSSIVADQPDKLKKLSGLVLLSALAVPVVGLNASANESPKKMRERARKTQTDALIRGLLKKSSPDLRSLYKILEGDFHPLSITSEIQPILQQLSEDEETKRYVEPLKEVVLTRLSFSNSLKSMIL